MLNNYKASNFIILKFYTYKGGSMNINNYNFNNYCQKQSFGAIRVPHEFDKKAYNISRDVFFKYHATGITAPDYCTMFF